MGGEKLLHNGHLIPYTYHGSFMHPLQIKIIKRNNDDNNNSDSNRKQWSAQKNTEEAQWKFENERGCSSI